MLSKIMFSKQTLLLLFQIFLTAFANNSTLKLSDNNFQNNATNSNSINCYSTQHNNTWKLVFEDRFDDEKIFAANWNVSDEPITFCTAQKKEDNRTTSSSNKMYCSNRKNSKLDHHFLVLSTHFEEDFLVDRRHFTGAVLTSTRHFGHGRYEIRAVQPVGWQIQTRLLTKNSKEMLPKSGQLNFASNNQDGSIYRDVQVVNASSGGGDDNQDENNAPILIDDELVVGELSQADEYLHRFHIYGMEWDSNGVRFFFDDHYSEVIVFSEFMKSQLKPAIYQIVLQMGIGGLLFEEKMLFHETSNLDKNTKSGDELNWKCPAFIIDYVRFYEKVENLKNESQQVIKCSDRKMLVQKSYKWNVVEEICQSAKRTTFFGKVYRLRKTLICLAVNIAIIILIAFLLYKIWSLRRRLSSDQKLLSIFGDQNVEGAEESDNTYEALGNDYEDFGEVETERPESNDNNHQVYGYQQSKKENNLNDKSKPVQEKTLEDIYAQVIKNKKVKNVNKGDGE